MEIILILAVLVAVIYFAQRRDRRFDVPPASPSLPPRPRRPPHRPMPTQQAQTPPAFDASTATVPLSDTIIEGAAYVIDGDSIVIQKTQVRLFGVDAPEMDHPYGKKAKWALLALCKGQKIRAEVTDRDDHGRTVARCFLPDGRDLSAEMVKQGLAIDWPKFSGGIYRQLEVPDARKKMWLADARQKGRMHVWEKYEARKAR